MFLELLDVTEPNDWESIANRWGLPILLLLAVGWAVWKVARWLAPRIDRLVDSHVGFVNAIEGRVENLEDISEDLKSNVASVVRNSEEQTRLLRSIDQKVTK